MRGDGWCMIELRCRRKKKKDMINFMLCDNNFFFSLHLPSSHQCPRFSAIRMSLQQPVPVFTPVASTLPSTLCAHRAKNPNLVNHANNCLTTASLQMDEKKGESLDENVLHSDRLRQKCMSRNGNVSITELAGHIGCHEIR